MHPGHDIQVCDIFCVILSDLLVKSYINYFQKGCHHQGSSYLEVVCHFCILFALHCVCMCVCQCWLVGCFED